MKLSIFYVVLIASLGFPSVPLAQVFGIEAGQKIESLDIIDDIGDGLYSVEVPTPVSKYFEEYVVLATPKAGVCMVRGIGKTIYNDAYGEKLRRDFSELRKLLERNYGNSELVSFLKNGALWDEPREWTMALRQGERIHQAEWDNEVGSTFAVDMEDIILSAKALSSDSSWIALQYRFSNIRDCRAEIDLELQDAL